MDTNDTQTLQEKLTETKRLRDDEIQRLEGFRQIPIELVSLDALSGRQQRISHLTGYLAALEFALETVSPEFREEQKRKEAELVARFVAEMEKKYEV